MSVPNLPINRLNPFGQQIDQLDAEVTALQQLPKIATFYRTGNQAFPPSPPGGNVFVGWTNVAAGSDTTHCQINGSNDALIDILETGWYQVELNIAIDWTNSDYISDDHFVSSIDASGQGLVPITYFFTPDPTPGSRAARFFIQSFATIFLQAGTQINGRVQVAFTSVGSSAPVINGVGTLPDYNTFLTVSLVKPT